MPGQPGLRCLDLGQAGERTRLDPRVPTLGGGAQGREPRARRSALFRLTADGGRDSPERAMLPRRHGTNKDTDMPRSPWRRGGPVVVRARASAARPFDSVVQAMAGRRVMGTGFRREVLPQDGALGPPHH